jgi:hypothetical protein
MTKLALPLAVLLASGSLCFAGPMVCDSIGDLYSINLATGALSNEVASQLPTSSGPTELNGMAYNQGKLYAVTEEFGTLLNSLITVTPATGAFTTVGSAGAVVQGLGMGIAGGSMAFDPTTNVLYDLGPTTGSFNTEYLVTINTTTGQGTVIGNPYTNSSGTVYRFSGMTFTPSGNLYAIMALAAGGNQSFSLVQLNKSTGSPTLIATLEGPAPSVTQLGGLSYDPASGNYYVLVGNNLDTINLTTGALAVVGATGNPSLVEISTTVPEPGSLALLAASGLALLRRRR